MTRTFAPSLHAFASLKCDGADSVRHASPGAGNQNAADGGIDVRVALPPGSAADGFVPRAASGFQVKKQDMPRAEIIDEMRPNDVIRPSIQKLADQAGAYIIVSSEGSTSDSALDSRRDAMREAMTGVPNADALDLDDFKDHSTEDIGTRTARTEALAQDLGKAVATEEAVLDELLPEVVSSDGRLWSFGQGLLEGAADAEKMWNRLVTALAATEEGLRKPQVLRGFLHELHARDPALASALLDNAVEHDTLARWYPFLQVVVAIDKQDVARLKRSLALGKTPVEMYIYLAYGRATDPIPAPDLKELVLTMAAMPSGYDVVIEILHMRLDSDEDRKEGIAPDLIDAGCELMQQFAFTKNNDREDYRLGGIAKSCLRGAKSAAVVKEICRKLNSTVS